MPSLVSSALLQPLPDPEGSESLCREIQSKAYPPVSLMDSLLLPKVSPMVIPSALHPIQHLGGGGGHLGKRHSSRPIFPCSHQA